MAKRCVVKLLVEMLEPFQGRVYDPFPGPKADYILLANSPFNMKCWGGTHLREDKRWKFDVLPVKNAKCSMFPHLSADLSKAVIIVINER